MVLEVVADVGGGFQANRPARMAAAFGVVVDAKFLDEQR